MYIYNEIFQQFLSKITSLQKLYQIQCFISLNINIYDRIDFTQNSPKYFKAIFPFIRTSYYLSKLPNEILIIFNEFIISLNLRNGKYDYNIIDNENENEVKENNNKNDIDYIYLKDFIEKKNKKNKKFKTRHHWKKLVFG